MAGSSGSEGEKVNWLIAPCNVDNAVRRALNTAAFERLSLHPDMRPGAFLIQPAMRNEVGGYQIARGLSTKRGVFWTATVGQLPTRRDLCDVPHFPALSGVGLAVKMKLRVACAHIAIQVEDVLANEIRHQRVAVARR
jgi:hypothetical protein